MAFSFIDVYFGVVSPNTCGINSKCLPPSAGGCSMLQVQETLNKATKKELEDLRELLGTLQRELDPFIEAAGKNPRASHPWGETEGAAKT